MEVHLSEAERQVLAAVHTLEQHPGEWLGGERLPLTRQRLLEHGRFFFSDRLEAWDEALANLEHRRLLECRDGLFHVSEAARPLGRRLRACYRRRHFERLLLQAERSTAYRWFCRQTYGLDLGQLSPLDPVQWRAVLQALDLTAGERLLEVGCGTGRLGGEIARRTGARVVSLDLAAGALAAGRQRSQPAPLLVAADLEPPTPYTPLAVASFDAILAIDSLAFLASVSAALTELRRLLRPGGRLLILTIEEGTGLTPLLNELGGDVSVIDFSARLVEILETQQFTARAVYPALKKEGHRALGLALLLEAERLAAPLAAGRLRRLLYRARASG